MSPAGALLLFHFWVVNSFFYFPWLLSPSLHLCFISLCVAPVALAIVFMPGLYPTASRATSPAFLCGWLQFVSTVCVFLFMFSILSRRCPLLATSCPSFSVCFPCSSPIPGLIWFGSVYLVTTAGFVADQFMWENNNNNNSNTTFCCTAVPPIIMWYNKQLIRLLFCCCSTVPPIIICHYYTQLIILLLL